MAETIQTAKELLKIYMHENIPCCIEGPPGVGKSELARQVADERSVKLIDLRLPQMDPVDLRGLPTVNNGHTTWARPDYWPDEMRDGKEGIILFDELADCGRAMQSAAYQVILDRRAGPHVIPPGWYPMAAGNRRQDKAAAQQLSTALASRFAWIEIEADHKCWYEYGVRKGFDHFVLGFIKAHPDKLTCDLSKADMRAFPCPRQWERVSRVMKALSSSNRPRVIGGLVGAGAAGEFEAFMKTMDLPDLADILADPKKCPIPEKPSSKYALSAMLSINADTKNFGKIMEYIKRREYGPDFEVSTVLDATKRKPELCDTKAYTEFAQRNQNIHL